MKRLSHLFLCLLLVASVLPSTSATDTGTEIGKQGGRMVLAALGDPKTFNIITANETSSTDIIEKHVFEGLVYYNPENRKIEPWLASSWEHSDDYLTWTFHLREGVQWNDGAPFTADDVLFSFEVVYDEKVLNAGKDFLEVGGEVFDVSKVDSHTVVIKIPSIYGPLERALADAFRIIPKHKLETTFREGKFNEALNVDTSPQDVVGTGPFRIKSLLSGERVVIERNPFYWKLDEKGVRLPYLDEIVFVIVGDLDAMDVKFEAGETDAHGIVPAKYKRFKKGEKTGNYTIYELGIALGESHIWFNQNRGKNPETKKPYVDPIKLTWFTNTKFRHAVSHCVDREGIIRSVFRGRGVSMYGPTSPGTGKWFNPDIPKFEYNLDSAKAVLDEINYVDRDGDGFREDPDGNKIQFVFITNRGNDIREQIGAILQERFKEVGLDGQMKLVDFNTLVTAIADSYDYEACLLGLTGSDHPLTGLNVYRSSGRTHEWYPQQKEPATEWEARVDELLEAFLAEPAEDKQVAIWHEVQRIYAVNQPMAWTVNPEIYLAVRNKFGNVRPQILRPRLLWNLEEIFVK